MLIRDSSNRKLLWVLVEDISERKKIERSAQQLATLINDLLDIEKLVAGKLDMNMQWQPLAPCWNDQGATF